MDKIIAMLAGFTALACMTSVCVAAENINAAIAQTQKLLEDNKGPAALVYIDAFIKTQPENAAALAERALVYGKLEKYDEALQDANRAIAIAPGLAVAYANRAAIYILTKKYEDAYNDSNKALSLNPKLATAYGMRALVYERLEKYQLDIDDCGKAIALEPKTARFYDYRATAFRKMGEYQKALTDCNRAISLAPRRFQAHIERGYTYLLQRNLSKALDDYNTAIGIFPRSANAYALRADVYRDLGQYQKQIDDLSQAIKLKPKKASFYDQRSHAHYLLGHLEDTLRDCDSTLAIEPDSPAANRAADACDEFGQYDKAIAYRTKAISAGPKNIYSWSGRAKDYELLGKFDLAKADWQKAFEQATAEEKHNIQTCNPLIDFKNFTGKSIKESIEAQLKEKPVILDFHYDEGGHICVPAKINGHALQLMLDTGCGHSDLWQAAMPGIADAERLKIKGTMASGKETEYGFFRAQEIKLGHLTIPDAAMESHEGLSHHKTLSGFLGGNILENMVVTIDYDRKKVILASSNKASGAKNLVTRPMRVSSHRPYCPITLDGHLTVSAILDTGNPSNISADAVLKPLLPVQVDYAEQTSGPWLGQLSTARLRFKSLACGEAVFSSPIIDVFPAAQASSAAKDIILGNPFLSRFRTVTFDYPGRKIIFETGGAQHNSASNLYWEGRYYLSHSQLQSAIDSFTRALALDSEFGLDCYFYRGRCYGLLKQYDKALSDANSVIKIEASAPWGYRLRSFAYDGLGQKEQAEKDREIERKFSVK